MTDKVQKKVCRVVYKHEIQKDNLKPIIQNEI